VLDGTDVFALSIHILSKLPEGEYQGQVLNYNPETTELTVSATQSKQSFKLFVPANTPVIREGQDASSSVPSGLSDLAKGTLISVRFESDKKGRGVASQISILAAPGSARVFSGSLTSLDLHSGLLVVVDPIDEKSYEIMVDFAQFPASRNLHQGDYVNVTATFDGKRYQASAIEVK
jgi:cold shock CspA family protein